MCHNYNFINTDFDYFSYFLLQDYIILYNTDSKIQVCHDYKNILNNCFDYFSYFLLQDGTKGLTTVSKIQVYHNDNFLKICFDYFLISDFKMVQRA